MPRIVLLSSFSFDMKGSVLEIKNQNENVFEQCYGHLRGKEVILLSGSCLPWCTVLLL